MNRAHPLTLLQTFNDQIQVGSAATYRFAPALPKPCVHPLSTPAGHVISGFEMSDHVWHRGLWFTIKFVNGTNFWEEHPPFGVQTSRAQPTCELLDQRTARISNQLSWTSEATGEVIRESRRVTVHVPESGPRSIGWTTSLLATQDLLLDRTPYTTWGGYGGLAFRTARELHDVSFLIPGGDTVSARAGESHPWIVMQSQVDGGMDQRVSIAMIDHPANPRSPSPWYCKCANGFNYMNPAILFHEPMRMARGESLRLAYRVMWRDGKWNEHEVQSLADSFASTNPHEAHAT